MSDYAERSGRIQKVEGFTVVIDGKELHKSRSYPASKAWLSSDHLGKTVTVLVDEHKGRVYVQEVVSPKMADVKKSDPSSSNRRTYGRMSPEELAFKKEERDQINRQNALSRAIEAEEANLLTDLSFWERLHHFDAWISKGTAPTVAKPSTPPAPEHPEPSKANSPVKKSDPAAEKPAKEQGSGDAKKKVESAAVNALRDEVLAKNLDWQELSKLCKSKFGKTPYFISSDTFQVFAEIVRQKMKKAAA